jgi:predicted DsbA family dithiol-disulfide isomerase
VRTDRLREEFDLAIRWSVFPLHPETPDEGQDLADLFAGHFDIDAMMLRVQQVAKELDLPLGQRTRTFNSRRAQEVGKWAEEQGVGEAFHMAVYRAYFVEGRNIALPEELAALASSLGLDAGAAREVIERQSYARAVDDDWQRAADLGVTAVPTSIYRQHALVGFQPYANYRKLITTAG